MLERFVSRVGYFGALASAVGFSRAVFAQATNSASRHYLPLRSKLNELRFHSIEHPIHFRVGTSDWQVMQEVLVRQAYAPPTPSHTEALDKYYACALSSSKRPLIVDCGANVGMTSVWYANRFPRALIYAIEPEPNNFSVLLKNCREYTNIMPMNAAISDRITRVSLSNSSDQSWAWETKESDAGAVQTITIPEVLAEVPDAAPFIVKIDIEGFETELFRSNLEWVRQFPLIVFESHDGLFPWRGTAHAILSVLCEQPRDYLQRDESTFALSHSLLVV